MMESLPIEMRRMILDHFSSTELLTISLVNKSFYSEARSLMRDRADLIVHLRKPCSKVLPFLSDLENMNLAPFSGVEISWNSDEHRKVCPRPNKILDSSLLHALHRVPWKRLSVRLHGGHYAPKRCPTLQLVAKLLQDFPGVLEQLEFNSHLKALQFVQEIIPDLQFPNLRVLKVEGLDSHYDGRGIKRNFIKEMLARAPNLQELYRDEPPNYSDNLLEGCSAVLVIVDCEFNPVLFPFPTAYAGTVKMTQMNLHCPHAFSMESFKRTVPRILQSSFDSLHFIQIDLLFLVPLMGYGVSFRNVKSFSIRMDYEDLELADPRIFSLLKNFDFTRTFPKVDRIEVRSERNSLDHVVEFVNEGIAALRELPLPDRAVNIKHVRLLNVLTAEAAPFLAGMFPNVETITTVMICGAEKVPYGCIWEHWPDLKELDVLECRSIAERTRRSSANLDSAFCGIFPEEVAALMKQDDEYLRAVNIVPVKPSLTCLRALRKFKLARLDSDTIPTLQEGMDPLFSKVSGLVAFQKCPNLSINIQTCSNEIFEALEPVRPYASVDLLD